MLYGTCPVGWRQEQSTGLYLPNWPRWASGEEIEQIRPTAIGKGDWCNYEGKYIFYHNTAIQSKRLLEYREFDGELGWVVLATLTKKELQALDPLTLVMEQFL